MKDVFSDSLRQLNKLSIYKPMQYRITEIELESADQDTVDEVMATTWEAVNADDLVEEITAATGLTVNSVDYCYVLQ
tara:strand:+ start:147 stop:377 length:231 start_codon:yes stop_codon:yes gene_type:complete